MEKKRNQIARNGPSSSDFKSKNQDVSNKQFPRQRRRESYQSENNNKQQSNKNRSNNFYYDKRPPARKGGGGLDQSTSTSCETSGLMEVNELNSVFNHGSRKQNLNHLLNFHYYTARDTNEVRAGTFSKHGYHHHRSNLKKYNFNKEQYLQANCQFVVKTDVSYDYRRFTISPDALVEWDQVVKIYVSSTEESQCPICLYPPKAARMTRCGHIFCFACILHYLSLSDKSWRKCPICYESVHLQDLKSATSKHNHRSYKVGDTISMELMTREKGSLYVSKAHEISINDFPNFSDNEDRLTHSKLIMANPNEIFDIINQEKSELKSQLIEDGLDCPESIFVQQAIDFLEEKQKELEKIICDKVLNEINSSPLNPSVPEFVPMQKFEHVCEDSLPSRDDFIDNECNLTINDIDIVPAANNSTSKHFFYYQAPNAQNVFLHSINSRMLQEMFGSLDKSPQKIQGRIVQIECCTMDEDLRKRLKYLQHLPVSSVFEVVEIEFESDLISSNVIDMFKDELLYRRKIRQRRERDERKHEKAINEINERQMGKHRKAASANIDIGSSLQFPECGSFNEMPALPSSVSDCSVSPIFSSSPAGPSFATMLTSPTGKKSEKLWPSLSSADGPSTSFFGDLKVVRVSENKEKLKSHSDDDENLVDDDETLWKVPAYKHQLGDCLANALAKSASLKETPKSNSKKKKAKKTLLFASGMNFN
ncbi:CLUMA_CG014348, isoform A [Clunio marinus]|uniref:E3 ubiquitin-protein ligase RNF10 n=1 Tax=Clunio marinus TaxID=568069 RepID=A0A1J1IP69_9DIPT|nr:CLUMA_CG014348, isoform A [Clunio marinus]